MAKIKQTAGRPKTAKKSAKKAPKRTVQSATKKVASKKVTKKTAKKMRATVVKSARATASTAEPKHTKKVPARHATAEDMALRQREIFVAEFFMKNRDLLGFDNPRKALLTTIKEGVDNSLDACEEAGILPDIKVTISA